MQTEITSPIILNDTGIMIAEAIKSLNNAGNICYGMHIDFLGESDPSASVEYLRDAVGMTPAYMDYTNDIFNYGSWGKDKFFMPRPCMLKTNGTVDYYLDDNDYTKKADGTASDIANVDYDGNAMMEWGRDGRIIYMKIEPDAGNPFSCSVYIANYKVDDDFQDYCFRDKFGRQINHFYTAIYQGSLDSNSKLRSISGQDNMRNKNASQEMSYAHNNGDGYEIDLYSDRFLINMLLVLMGKSLDTQSVFGRGKCDMSWDESNLAKTGTLNDKGLFYGKNDGITCVKVFGMENWWGNQWRRMAGLIMVNGIQKVKLTYSTIDGSTVSGYNTDGSGYIEIADSTPSGTSGGYISKVLCNKYGIHPIVASGSSSTRLCDGLWFNNTIVAFALVGGYLDLESRVGAFCVVLHDGAGNCVWNVDAALSYKPLAA